MTHMRFAAGLIVLAAACAPAPQAPAPSCPCPPPKPEAETARYEARAFSDLPGWSNAQLEPSLRAFVAGCARFKRVCEIARGLPAGDERVARNFFETEFVPYALVSSVSGDSGMVT